MNNLQYIGARYVPKIYTNPDDNSSDWKSGVTYEALTIVTYNGDSYTSKKAVPNLIGNPASNPDYWVKTGDFNASLLALQNRMTGAEEDIDDLEAVVYRERFVLFVGDSYAMNPNTTNHYPSDCAAALGLDNSHYAVLSGSGKGFKDDEYLGYITNYSGDKNAVTDIVVLGGLNDLHAINNGTTVATLKQNVDDFMDYANANYPNAKVWVGLCGWEKNVEASYSYILNYKSTMEVYTRATMKGAAYIDGFNKILHNYNYMLADKSHPNDLGERLIGYALASVLNGGDLLSIKNFERPSFSAATDPVDSVPVTCEQTVDNNNLYLEIAGNLTFTTAKTWLPNRYFDVMTIGTSFIDAGSYSPEIMINVEVTDDNNATTQEMGQMKFNGTTVYLSLNDFTGNVKTISFPYCLYPISLLHI